MKIIPFLEIFKLSVLSIFFFEKYKEKMINHRSYCNEKEIFPGTMLHIAIMLKILTLGRVKLLHVVCPLLSWFMIIEVSRNNVKRYSFMSYKEPNLKTWSLQYQPPPVPNFSTKYQFKSLGMYSKLKGGIQIHKCVHLEEGLVLMVNNQILY